MSKFGPRLAGAGGFIAISQSAKKVVFAGTFLTGECDIGIAGGQLQIRRDGATRKFVDQVEHRTFSGAHAAAQGKQVHHVTERCVFELRADGLTLTEIAPGVDLERDVLGHMAFRPLVDGPCRMDPRFFRDTPMELCRSLVDLPWEARFAYDASRNVLYLNFERLEVNTPELVDAIGAKVLAICKPIGHPCSRSSTTKASCSTATWRTATRRWRARRCGTGIPASRASRPAP